MKTVRLTDDPAYGAAFHNLEMLEKRLSDLHQQKQTADAAAMARRKIPLGAEMVVGLDLPDSMPEAAPDLAQILNQTREVENAIKLQRDVLRKLETAAASNLCSTLVPDYFSAVQQLSDSLTAFGKAADAVRGFHDFYQGQCGLPLVHPLAMVPVEIQLYSLSNPAAQINRLRDRVLTALETMQAKAAPTPTTTPEPTPAPVAEPVAEVVEAAPSRGRGRKAAGAAT